MPLRLCLTFFQSLQDGWEINIFEMLEPIFIALLIGTCCTFVAPPSSLVYWK